MSCHPEHDIWEREILAESLARFPERNKSFHRHGGREVTRLALPETISDSYLEQCGFPGQYPFTRGVQPTMHRGRLWTMRQYAGFSTAAETNRRFHYLLEQGTTGLSVAFDLPTQIGYDSDDEVSVGEVGKVGVAIDSLADMELLFDRIPLDRVSTSMTINAPAVVLLAMYVVVAEKQAVPPDRIRGTIQNDVLKEYFARGTYIFPPRPSLKIVTDLLQWCAENAPGFNSISISGYHIREAGSTAAQEVAFTLANGGAYVQAAIDAGLDVDRFAGRLSFFFAAHSNLLEEVAKFRAARRMWARMMKKRFHAKKDASCMLRFHTQTGGSTLTAQQPDNNIVRVALQALAAVLGGTQSLHTNSRDEALSLPTEEAVRVALRTQQIIAHESGVADTVDPLAGSYFVEQLTDAIEQEAEGLLKAIEQEGGVTACIEKGWIQRQIENSAYEFQQEIEKKERLIVGMNCFQVEEDARPPLYRSDPLVEDEQVARLRQLKQERDNRRVAATLAALRQVASDGAYIVPAVLEAVRAYATVGEVCNALRAVFGEYRE